MPRLLSLTWVLNLSKQFLFLSIFLLFPLKFVCSFIDDIVHVYCDYCPFEQHFKPFFWPNYAWTVYSCGLLGYSFTVPTGHFALFCQFCFASVPIQHSLKSLCLARCPFALFPILLAIINCQRTLISVATLFTVPTNPFLAPSGRVLLRPIRFAVCLPPRGIHAPANTAYPKDRLETEEGGQQTGKDTERLPKNRTINQCEVLVSSFFTNLDNLIRRPMGIQLL